MLRTHKVMGTAAFVIATASMVRIDGHQCNFAAFGDKYRANAVKITLTANAAAAAVSLTVAALPAEIPAGAMLTFGEAGELARVTTTTAAGLTALPVEPLGSAIENGDVAYYSDPKGNTEKVIPGGTAVGEDGDGLLIPAVNGNAIGLTVTDMVEDDGSQAITGFGVFVGGPVWENLLPDATGAPKVLPAGIKTALAASGTGFAFRQYVDSFASQAVAGLPY